MRRPPLPQSVFLSRALGPQSDSVFAKNPANFIWIGVNLGLPFWNLPTHVRVPDNDLNVALSTLLEDGMTFSGSIH